VYGLDKLPSIPEMNELRENLKRLRLNNFSRFSLAENESGILFWAGPEQLGEAENRILSRLERIGQRALANASEFEKMEAKTYTDALTGLYNHRYFVKRLNEEIQRASRYKRRLGLMLFDIDDFKVFNDKFGHQWGDELLRVMGMTLSKSLRSVDIVSRYGGDEFCIIMPEADRSTCAIFMERLRKSIADTDFRVRENGFEGRVTISIGAAIFPDDADNADRLIYSADMALLRSKAKGRNCSTCFTAELLEK
jgi:diguanylate cyclase (GGDEF)-like protein